MFINLFQIYRFENLFKLIKCFIIIVVSAAITQVIPIAKSDCFLPNPIRPLEPSHGRLKQVLITIGKKRFHFDESIDRKGHQLALLFALHAKLPFKTILIVVPVILVKIFVFTPDEAADDVEDAELTALFIFYVH